MKLTVKTIKGETFKIDVEPFTTVNIFLVKMFAGILNQRKDLNCQIISDWLSKDYLKRKCDRWFENGGRL